MAIKICKLILYNDLKLSLMNEYSLTCQQSILFVQKIVLKLNLRFIIVIII